MSCRVVARLMIATCAIGPASCLAVEGGVGRSFVGAQILPYAGVIPPEPGLSYAFEALYIDGSIGGSKQAPIAGELALNLDAKFWLEAVSFAYIWDTGPSKWNFASIVGVPFDQTKATADVSFGSLSARVSDSSSGLFDMTFVPVIASYHVSQVEHWSFALYVDTPTGSYTAGQLANNSLNNWTFTPAVGYTKLFQEGTLEFSALAGVDIYTKNDATNYQNGSVFRLDTMLIKRSPSGWGFGVIGGWLEQLDKDTGPTADKVNGFKGHSFGIGPVVSYTKAWSKTNTLNFGFRYIKAFDVKNELDGDPIMLTLSLTL
jgi:hypothetical protein